VGSYEFSADVVQYVVPVANAANVGQTSRQSAIHLEGQANLQAGSVYLALWSQGGSLFDSSDAAEFKIEGGHTYFRQGGGAWQETGDVLDAFAPQGDFLSFLAGAQDIQPSPTPSSRSTVYHYRLDGPQFARYMRDQMEQLLSQRGELRPGMELGTSRMLEGMSGSGELWVGDDGLLSARSPASNLRPRETNRSKPRSMSVSSTSAARAAWLVSVRLIRPSLPLTLPRTGRATWRDRLRSLSSPWS